MSAPVLYSFRRCPYAMRARLAIAAAGVEVRLREVLLRDKPDEMLALSPKGTVPVLHVENTGQAAVIDESLAVMRWALDQNDPEGWLTPETGGLEEMLSLIAVNDGPFKHDLDRYKYSTRYEGADRQEHRAAGAAFLGDLNDRLEAGGQLFGARPALADMAIFPFVRQFRIADPDWFDGQNWERLKAWLSHHMNAQIFMRIMEKYTPWKISHTEQSFPPPSREARP